MAKRQSVGNIKRLVQQIVGDLVLKANLQITGSDGATIFNAGPQKETIIVVEEDRTFTAADSHKIFEFGGIDSPVTCSIPVPDVDLIGIKYTFVVNAGGDEKISQSYMLSSSAEGSEDGAFHGQYWPGGDEDGVSLAHNLIKWATGSEGGGAFNGDKLEMYCTQYDETDADCYWMVSGWCGVASALTGTDDVDLQW